MSTLFLKNFVTFLLRAEDGYAATRLRRGYGAPSRSFNHGSAYAIRRRPAIAGLGRDRFHGSADGIRRLVFFAEAPGAREASKPVQLTPRADFLKRLPGSH